MKIFSEIFPTTILETYSPFSGKIRVVDFRGEKRLMIGDLVQSVSLNGTPIGHKVWGRLAAYPFKSRKVASVLILGLGGGTVAHLISRSLKPSKIVGVEADPVVAEVGQKYFDFGEIKGLEVVVEDACKFLKKDTGQYDFVVVDTYQGDAFPKPLESRSLLLKLRSRLSEDGVLVFNRIFLLSQPHERLSFLRKLERVFGQLKEEVIEGPSDAKNYLYWVLPHTHI